MTADFAPAPAAAAPAPRGRTGALARRIAWLSFGVALLVVALGSAYVLVRDRAWLPTGDMAYNQLEIQRIGSDWPLLGSWSRYGWSHPGPAMFYLAWLPVKLLGGASIGMLLAMLLMHLGAVVLAWFAAVRRSVGAAVVVVGAMLLVWAVTGPGDASRFWNPAISLMLSGALLVLAWDAALRGRLGTLLLLPVGSLLAQSHLGTVLMVALLTTTACVLSLVHGGQPQGVRWPWRAWVIGGLVTLVMWLPPVIEQVTKGGDGNLSRILAVDLGPASGLSSGIRVLLDTFSLSPYWWSPTVLEFLPRSFDPPWLLALPVAAAAVAGARRDAVHLRFLALGGAAMAALVVSVARVADPFAYLVTWGPTLAMVVVAGSIWILLASFDRDRWLAYAAPVVLIVPAVGVAVNLISNAAPDSDFQSAMQAVVRAARERSDTGIVLLEGERDSEFEGSAVGQANAVLRIPPGVVAALQHEGIPIAVHADPTLPDRPRSMLPADVTGKQELLLRTFITGRTPPPAGWTVIDESVPFTEKEWTELASLARASQDESLQPVERYWALRRYQDVRAGRVAWQLLERTPAPAAGSSG